MLLGIVVAVLLGVESRETQLDSIIYQYFSSVSPDMSFAFRRLNHTNQVGAQSDPAPGAAGTLYHVKTKAELADLLTGDEKRTFAPFAFIMEIGLFDGETSALMRSNSDRVAQLITYRDEKLKNNFTSPDTKCGRVGVSCEHEWNPSGSGVMWEDYPFSIVFYKNQTIMDTMIAFYEQYNVPLDFPVVQYQGVARMVGAIDSPTCIRRTNKKYYYDEKNVVLCDPYGGYTLIQTVPALPKAENQDSKLPDNSVILVTAQSDHASFFTKSGAGTISQVMLLAMRKALSGPIAEKLKEAKATVVFALLPSEDLGNIGASSLIYDFELDRFPRQFCSKNDESPECEIVTRKWDNGSLTEVNSPVQIKPRSIKAIIELGELEVLEQDIYLHADESVDDQIYNAFVSSAGSLSVKRPTGNFGLPPGSVKTLLNGELKPHAYVGDFDSAFKNPFYHSMFNDDINGKKYGLPDDYCESTSKGNAHFIHLFSDGGSKFVNLANTLAQAVLKLAGVSEEAKVENETVQELICCFLISPRGCDAVSNLFNVTYVSYNPSLEITASVAPELRTTKFNFNSQIVRTATNTSIPTFERVTLENTLIYYGGEEIPCVNQTDCIVKCTPLENGTLDLVYQYALLNNGTQCFKSSFYSRLAWSPAFQKEDYDLVENKDNYSLWTESEWAQVYDARIFLVQSPMTNTVSVSVGIISIFFAFLISWTMKWKASSIFVSGEGIANPVASAAGAVS